MAAIHALICNAADHRPRYTAHDDFAVALARVTLGVALVHRPTPAERDRGQTLLAEVSEEVFLRRGYLRAEVPLVEVYAARERARRADRDDALPLMAAAVGHLFREGQLLLWAFLRRVFW